MSPHYDATRSADIADADDDGMKHFILPLFLDLQFWEFIIETLDSHLSLFYLHFLNIYLKKKKRYFA